MKLVKIEDGIKLIPETDFEKECLEHISNKTLVAEYEDVWNQSLPMTLKFKRHPWDKS